MAKFQTLPEPEDDPPTVGDGAPIDALAKNTGETVSRTEPADSEDCESRTPVAEIRADDKLAGLRIEAVKDDDGWHWMLFGANGRPLATNVNPIRTKYDVKKTIRTMQDAIQNASLMIRME